MSTKVLIPNNPAEADPRTRDHIQKVAVLLNDLIRAGLIDLGPSGTYTLTGSAATLENVFFGRAGLPPQPRIDDAPPLLASRFFGGRSSYGVM